MSMSSPSRMRLPHASAGPFWAPQSPEPRHEWHEIETLLGAAASGRRSTPQKRHGLHSFALVALVLGGGVLAMTMMGSRSDCGAACHVATATPSGGAPHADAAALAPAPDGTVKEGRSAAEPVLDMSATAAAPDSAASDPVVPEPAAPPLRHRHHHHHWAHP